MTRASSPASGRPAQRPRHVLRHALPITVLLAFGCSTGEVRVCEDENESMLSDGKIRIHQDHTLADPTAGGRLAGSAPEGSGRPRRMVLLLDYSGSMYGGYGLASPPSDCKLCAGRQPFYFAVPAFENLLARWLDTATPEGTTIDLEILLFNARLWRLGENGVEPYKSPDQLTYPRPVSSASAEQIHRWLAEIPDVPRQVDAEATLATNSRQALLSVVDGVEEEVLVWLVTDNIVDTGGGVVSAADARRKLEFYDTLRDRPRIQMINAYPVFQEDRCSWMCGTSLFFYGMVVSPFERPSSQEFHRLGGTTSAGIGPTRDGLLWNADLAELAASNSGRGTRDVELAGVPLRLKPIDTEVLGFEFQLHQGQALRCSRSAEFGDSLSCAIRARVRNNLRHQTVESARLSLSNHVMLPRKPRRRERLAWASAVCGDQMKPILWRLTRPGAEPVASREKSIELGPLAPLATAEVEMLFELPAIHVATGDRAHLFDVALTDRFLLDGRVQAEIRDIRTSLYLDTGGLEEVYGARELPAIFRGRQQGRIEAIYPAGAVVKNDGQLLGLLLLAGFGSLGALLTFIVLRFQNLYLSVSADGAEIARLKMPRLSYRSLDIRGQCRATVVRGWRSAYRLRPAPGHHLRKTGNTWILTPEGGGEEICVNIRRGWGRSGNQQKKRNLGLDDNW